MSKQSEWEAVRNQVLDKQDTGELFPAVCAAVEEWWDKVQNEGPGTFEYRIGGVVLARVTVPRRPSKFEQDTGQKAVSALQDWYWQLCKLARVYGPDWEPGVREDLVSEFVYDASRKEPCKLVVNGTLLAEYPGLEGDD